MQCSTYQHENPNDAIICEISDSSLDTFSTLNESDSFNIDPLSLAVGALIGNRYLIVEEISRNTRGFTYRVQDTACGDVQYILNLLHPGLINDQEARTRFREEITVCMDFVHEPKILFDRLESGQGVYYYLTGLSLKEYQKTHKGKTPLFTLEEIRIVMQSLLATLDYVHQFTVHNNILPENIIMMGVFPEVSIRLIGFGVDDTLPTSSRNKTEAKTESLVYMASEQINSPLAPDRRADLFSVGMILYEMLTSEKAVDGFVMPSEYFSEAYKPLDRVLEKVLSSNVDHRHSTASELSTDICSALTEVTKNLATSPAKQKIKQLESSTNTIRGDKILPKSKDQTRMRKHASREIQKAKQVHAKKPPKVRQTQDQARMIKHAFREIQKAKQVHAKKPPKVRRTPLIGMFSFLLCLIIVSCFFFKKSSSSTHEEMSNNIDHPGQILLIEPTDSRKIPKHHKNEKLQTVVN